MSTLRLERQSLSGANIGQVAETGRAFEWVVYSGPVAVLRCEAEADARGLLQILRRNAGQAPAGATTCPRAAAARAPAGERDESGTRW